MLRKRLNQMAHRRDKEPSKQLTDSGQHHFAILFQIFLVVFKPPLIFAW